MKKIVSFLGYALLAMIVLYPLGVIISDCFGYTFKLNNYPAFAVISALIAISEVALSVAAKHPVKSKALAALFLLATPLSVVNTAFYMLESSSASVVASMIICICSCCYLTLKYGKSLVLKIIALVSSALMLWVVCFVAFISLVFGGIGQNTVVQSVESPNGEYYAEVIDSDQGALGGDTLVKVHHHKVDLIIFKICKRPQTVYIGEWGEFQDMQIYWKDDNCLVINNGEYNIE